MRIPFEKRRDTVIPTMYGGEGAVSARMYVDGDNKIMEGVLAPGCSIGLHSHQNSSEIVYILSGTGKALFDEACETLSPGDCHYCPRGHSHSLINDGTEELRFFAVVPEHAV